MSTRLTPTACSRRDRINPSNTYSPLTHVTAGGIAGAVAAAVTTPLDVCKTLLQTRGLSSEAQIRNARGLTDAFRIIYQRQGLMGFTRGMAPRILTNVPSNALCCTSPFAPTEWRLPAEPVVVPQGCRTKASASSSRAATTSRHQSPPFRPVCKNADALPLSQNSHRPRVPMHERPHRLLSSLISLRQSCRKRASRRSLSPAPVSWRSRNVRGGWPFFATLSRRCSSSVVCCRLVLSCPAPEICLPVYELLLPLRSGKTLSEAPPFRCNAFADRSLVVVSSRISPA